MGLTTALSLTPPIGHPGYILSLRGGSYHGKFVSTVKNAQVQPYQNEHPIIDGAVTISGAGQTWQDIEIMYSGWESRYSPIPGSNPPGDVGWARLLMYGQGAVMRHCTIHDLADVGWGVGASDSIVEDCLTYNIGWDGPVDDRAHGHGWYIQNDASGPKTMRRCVSVLNYATPAKIYGVNAELEQITIEDCVFAFGKEGYTYVRSDNGAAHNITIKNLLTYGVQWDHSNFAPGGGPISVDGGVIVPPDNVDWYAYQNTKNWQAGANVKRLQVVARRAVSYWKDAMPLPFMDENEYHIIPPSNENAPFVAFGGAISANLAAWQVATGNDTHSTYDTGLPAQPRIDVIERTQDRVVVVYNWHASASVIAPISGTYRNALNLAETMVLSAGDPLPMDRWSSSVPIGADAPVAPYDSRFGVFVVEE